MPAFDFVLAGRYRLIAPLGEGGMAAVYRARDLRLNREVAVKVLRDELTGDPAFLARFQREAELVASLSHPHIVPVYDVGEHRDVHFIVMEYIRGRSLRDALDMQGPLPPARAVEIMRCILDALAYAHSRGLIHRDVKPHNILVSHDGTPKLADFGIAHLADASVTRTAAILGSAHYLSPEQSRGEEATVQSDIYACGIVLYEMIAGYPPFDGPNALAIASKHLSEDPLPLDVDQQLERPILRALRKEPQQRYPDAASFGTALPAGPAEIPSTATAIQPLQLTSANPHLPTKAPEAESGSTAPVPQPNLTLRRSGRKLYGIALIVVVLLCAAAVLLPQAPLQSYHLPPYPSLPYLILPTVVAAVLLADLLYTRSWRYSITTAAAVAQWGVLGHRRLGIPLRQITRLELKQSPLERLLGIGTIELHGRQPDGTPHLLILEDVARPRATYDTLMQVISAATRTSLPPPALVPAST